MRRIPYSDTSLVVRLFTANRGAISILVKGAFRPTSPYFAAFDLLDRVVVGITERKNSSLAMPTSIETVENHRRLRERWECLCAAFYSAELVDVAATEQPQPELFESFSAWLAFLDREARPTTAELRRELLRFEIAFLDSLGFGPVFEGCAECGRVVADFAGALVADAAAGGLVCPACAARRPAPRRPVSRAMLELVATLRGANGHDLESGTAARPADAELRAFLDLFHRRHLDYSPRSRPSIELLWH
jgi:DNA repair protein RecO (recombination protein O)